MKTVAEIIRILRGDHKGLAARWIKLDNPGWMPLSIELIQDDCPFGPGVIIGVSHTYVQNGDLMSDPFMSFRVDGDTWVPLSYLQDGLGINQQAFFIGDDDKTMVRPKLLKQLNSFCKMWDRNLRDQRFIIAAKEMAAKEISEGNSQA